MEIVKRIEIGEYVFHVILKSKTAYAHSLMTDDSDLLHIRMAAIRTEMEETLKYHAEAHKERKKG